jgi:hypothetical protein
MRRGFERGLRQDGRCTAADSGHERQQHSMPEKPAETAMLIYPGMTALDLIGPQQVFDYLPGVKVELSPRRRTW